MPSNLEDLLAQLQRAPLDRSLNDVIGAVEQRVTERAAANAQTWTLRAVAMALVGISGVMASVSTTAAANSSPLVAWSTLAPSTLLEFND